MTKIEDKLVEFNVATAEIGALVPELTAFFVSLEIDVEIIAEMTGSNQFSILVLIMETLKMIEVEGEIVIATEGTGSDFKRYLTKYSYNVKMRNNNL